jgi:MraZ protein
VEQSRATIFLGQFEHAVDDKNRLFLPARFRDKNASGPFIMTQGLEGCLFLYPPQAWEALAGKLEQMPIKNKIEERAIKRTLLAGAIEAEADGQGRILIPQHLKEYAGIRRDAVIIGMLRHMEVWAKERWKPYHKKARRSFDKAAGHLAL